MIQQDKLRKREEEEQLKEMRKAERERAKEQRQKLKQAPPKRVRIILHVKPKGGEGTGGLRTSDAGVSPKSVSTSPNT